MAEDAAHHLEMASQVRGLARSQQGQELRVPPLRAQPRAPPPPIHVTLHDVACANGAKARRACEAMYALMANPEARHSLYTLYYLLMRRGLSLLACKLARWGVHTLAAIHMMYTSGISLPEFAREYHLVEHEETYNKRLHSPCEVALLLQTNYTRAEPEEA